jgi:hypothetical protein
LDFTFSLLKGLMEWKGNTEGMADGGRSKEKEEGTQASARQPASAQRAVNQQIQIPKKRRHSFDNLSLSMRMSMRPCLFNDFYPLANTWKKGKK